MNKQEFINHRLTTEQADEIIAKHYEATGKKLNIPIPKACCFDINCELCQGRGLVFGNYTQEASKMNKQEFIKHMKNWLPGMPLPDGWKCERRCRREGDVVYMGYGYLGIAYDDKQIDTEWVFTPTTQTITIDLEVPEGYRAVEYRKPTNGEFFLSRDGKLDRAVFGLGAGSYFILEKVE